MGQKGDEEGVAVGKGPPWLRGCARHAAAPRRSSLRPGGAVPLLPWVHQGAVGLAMHES